MKSNKGFRFKKRRPQPVDISMDAIRARPSHDDEGLTGYVHGQPAGSQDEERFARAFNKVNLSFQYQTLIPTETTMPGQDKRVDFIIENRLPFEPRGHISHYFSIAQTARDRIRELQLNQVFSRVGLLPLKVAKYTEYDGGQEGVDNYVRRNLV